MATRTITRLASAAVVTGIASLALAAPAGAQFPKDPGVGGGIPTDTGGTLTTDEGWSATQLASGALGGLALAGVGIGAAAGLRRHRQTAHPA